MPRPVFYNIKDSADGRFDVVAILDPCRFFRRDGFSTLAEAEEWIDGLRILMAAIGAPLIQAKIDQNIEIVLTNNLAQICQDLAGSEVPKG